MLRDYSWSMISFARKNGKTRLQDRIFRRKIEQLSPPPTTIPDATGYAVSEPEILETDQVLDHEVQTLLNESADRLDEKYGKCMSQGSYRPLPGDKALYIVQDEQIVSILLWTTFGADVWIGMAWTREEYRRLGYYKLLYDRLKEIAKGRGYLSISCGVNERNRLSRQVHESIGMRAFSIQYTQEL